MVCPQCFATVSDRARFCSECGGALSRSSAGAERKVITALFCDLVDSTAMAERVDPEDMDVLLRGYGAIARVQIRSNGGIVEKFIGDAVVGLFGTPLAHEDDPARAIASARGIIDEMRNADLGLQVRIGVNTGEAFVHPSIDPSSGEGLATGDCINTAARLQSLAPAMGIMVGDRTRDAARSYSFEDGGLVRVKGKVEPVQVWRVTGAQTTVPTGDAPFVGRGDELARVGAMLDRLHDGNGALVVIEGEPGIGKSRLANEVRSRTADLRWLRGRSIETPDTKGYRPFGEQVRAWIGTSLPAEDALASHAAEIGVPDEDTPFLATLAGIRLPLSSGDRIEDLPADVIRSSIYRATRAWIEALTAERSLVLEFEDWHWADGASVGLLRHVLPLTSTHPLAVVVLTRPQEIGPATSTGATESDQQRSLTLSLTGLDDSAAHDLARSLGGGRLSDEQITAVSERAEGNPYFLQELMRYVEEQGDAPGSLPDTVRGVVISRVDRLDAGARAVLRTCSVIGRVVPYDLLLHLQTEADLQMVLDGLVDSRLLQRISPSSYRFAHALTREAVYEGVPIAERRILHRAIADALQEAPGAQAAAHLPSIAYHLAQAQDWERASATLLQAAGEAARLASDDEALDRFREAIRAHERLPSGVWTPLERARIDRQVAEALVRLGRHDEATRQVSTALARLDVRVADSRRRVRRDAIRQLLPRLMGPPPLPRADKVPTPTEIEIARELELLGWITFFDDLDRYALATMMLTNRAARTGVLDGVGVGLWRSAIAFGSLGRARLSYRYMARALEAADRMSDGVEIARLKQGLTLVPFAFGGYEDAKSQAALGMELGGAAGDLRSWGTGGALLAWTEINHGDLSEGHAIAQRVALEGSDGGDLQVEGFGVALMGVADMYREEPTPAVEQLHQARELLLRVPDHITNVALDGILAMSLLRLDDRDGARAVIARSREEVVSRGLRGFMLSYLVQAETELAMVELASSARRNVSSASGHAVRRSVRHAKLCRWHAGHAGIMDGCRSWLLGRQAVARKRFEKTTTAADRLGHGGVTGEAFNWVRRCCEVGGLDPPRSAA
jgi:class 3 adenylate cyclase